MDVNRATDLYAQGWTLRQIGAELGLTETTVQRESASRARVASLGLVSEAEELITSARRAAAVCGVTRFAVRAWIDRGLLPQPPWTAQQLR